MRKIIFILVCITAVNGSVFCLQEGYVSMGYGYKQVNVFTGDTELLGKEKGMLGFTINGYGFWNDSNVGLYLNAQYIRPVYVSQGNEGPGILSGLTQDYTIGVAFRLPVGNTFMLLFGLGPNFITETVNCYMFDYQKFHKSDILNIGFCGEVSAKFNIAPNLYFISGLNVSYSFVNYTHIYETYRDKDSGWAFQSILGNRFFIGIGVYKIR
ncbi:MAG: hypothetical protein LBV17_09060 [Treponema sp.]|jgi:hypothetical protein|nr:hypothetical protein [Treponema sp.]